MKKGCLYILIFLIVIFPFKGINSSIYARRGAKSYTKTVEIRKLNNTYQLYRKGNPYFIKGASGFKYFDKIIKYGGNSIRTWNTDNAKKTLDEADSLGLTVTIGLFIGSERFGFDYDNAEEVKKQLESVRQEIIRFKDHPALLMWGIGNEVELESTNYKFWDAINDIAKMIHHIDPNHPTTTMLAGITEKHVVYLKKHCQAIDILSINTFRDLPNIPMKVKKFGWTKPYLISEWGPTGYWESRTTPWGTFIEETSSEKAAILKMRYAASIQIDTANCIGSYVFLWGTKQERTHTLFSLFLDSVETESLDVIQYLWSGKYPENKTPHVNYLILDGKTSLDNIYLKSNSSHSCKGNFSDPENDRLTYKWEIRSESMELKTGTVGENKPEIISGLIREENGDKMFFKTPMKEGAYRLFVYAFDTDNNVATANIPFYIKQ